MQINLSHEPDEIVEFSPCDGDWRERMSWDSGDTHPTTIMQMVAGRIAAIVITKDSVAYKVNWSAVDLPSPVTFTTTHFDGMDLRKLS